MRHNYQLNYEGKQFGRWTVLDQNFSSTHWVCRCECGLERPIQKYSLLNGLSAGCKACNNAKDRTISKNTRWNEGGYVRISAPEDYLGKENSKGHIIKRKQVFEHIYIMSKMLGRPLRHNEMVHHKNGDRSDNSPHNLELWHKGQPPGQRMEDKIAWCVEFLRTYAPDVLKS